VSSATANPARPSVLDRSHDRWRAPSLAIRALAVAAIAFVVTTSFQAHPGPGGNGAGLAVTIALVAFCGATLAAMWLAPARPSLLAALLVIAVVSTAALLAIQANGAAFLGVFPAVSLAALVLPERLSGLVAAVAVTAVSAAWVSGRTPVAGIVLNDFGVVAVYLLSMFARRLRDSNQQAELLLAELEQSRAGEARAAALGERQRLAREMHDVLAHSLSGLVLNLEGARLLARQSSADAKVSEAIDRAHRLARTGLEEARRAIGMLRDDALPGPERLAALAAQFQEDSGIACTVEVTGQVRELGTDGRLTLYRVAQEALTNVRKHSVADRVELRLGYEPVGTRLAIADFAAADGKPTSIGSADGTGYGLTGMRERAELLGGSLVAGPTSDGFAVELWVPA
jgi:signal transduction histidine kinase